MVQGINRIPKDDFSGNDLSTRLHAFCKACWITLALHAR